MIALLFTGLIVALAASATAALAGAGVGAMAAAYVGGGLAGMAAAMLRDALRPPRRTGGDDARAKAQSAPSVPRA